MSQISYEDGFQNAEYNALTEEDRARERREAKERKLKEFQDKTKKAANKKLQEMQQNQKLSAVEEKLKERERLMKAKDYAQKQRGLVSRKKGRDSQLEQDPAGVHTNFHAQIKKEQENDRDLTDVEEEKSEIDDLRSQKAEEIKMETAHESINLKDLYQRIDQEEMEKLGVSDKTLLTERAIVDLHAYSMLQRFRHSKDFKLPDKYTVKVSSSAHASNKTKKAVSYASG